MPLLNAKSFLPRRALPIPIYILEIAILIVLVSVTLMINSKMIRDGTNGMTDLKWHITWLQHFTQQLHEGIWYPRWLAGTNYGYGSPTFVFYPPLVFYLGSLLKTLGLNAEYTVIALFSLTLFGCGFNFYLYGRNRWGKVAACVGAIAYMSLPYLAFDTYWRGGLASMFTQALIPLGLYCTDQALSRPHWRWALAICFAAIALTHVPSLLLCSLVWLPYLFLQLLYHPWRAVVATLIYAGIGLGLASFYLLPAVFEQSLVSIKALKGISGGYAVNMIGNLANLKSSPTTAKLIGNAFRNQSLLTGIGALIAVIGWRRNSQKLKEIGWWLFFLILLAFLMSYWSLTIWQSSSTLQMVQFPWRLMQIFSLGTAAMVAMAVSGILQISRRNLFFWLFSTLIISLLLFNLHNFHRLAFSVPTINNPGRGKPIADVEWVSTALDNPFSNQLVDVKEYRPLVNQQPPPPPKTNQSPVSVIRGKAQIEIKKWASYHRQIAISTSQASQIRVRTYYYPAWHLYINQELTPIQVAEDGTITFSLELGDYNVELRYLGTKTFKIGLLLSILTLITLIIVIAK